MYWNKQIAAGYLGIEPEYLIRQIKLGRGPQHIRPSERVRLFNRDDLDAWKATWKTETPHAER